MVGNGDKANVAFLAAGGTVMEKVLGARMRKSLLILNLSCLG